MTRCVSPMNLRNLFRILPGYAELKIDDKMKNLTAILFTGLSTLTMVTGQAQSIADNWHQWRGPENSGVSRTAKPPLKWSEGKNLKWKAEIQGQRHFESDCVW